MKRVLLILLALLLSVLLCACADSPDNKDMSDSDQPAADPYLYSGALDKDLEYSEAMQVYVKAPFYRPGEKVKLYAVAHDGGAFDIFSSVYLKSRDTNGEAVAYAPEELSLANGGWLTVTEGYISFEVDISDVAAGGYMFTIYCNGQPYENTVFTVLSAEDAEKFSKTTVAVAGDSFTVDSILTIELDNHTETAFYVPNCVDIERRDPDTGEWKRLYYNPNERHRESYHESTKEVYTFDPQYMHEPLTPGEYRFAVGTGGGEFYSDPFMLTE